MAGIEIKTDLLHMAAEGYGTSAVSCTLAVLVRRNTSIEKMCTFSDRLVQL